MNDLNDSIQDYHHSELASSGYSTVMIDSEQEEIIEITKVNNIEPKEEIEEKEREREREKERVKEVGKENQKEEKEKGERVEKSKTIKITRNQITLKQRSPEEVREFQRQETERYKNPHLPYTYVSLNGVCSVVAPIIKKQPTSLSNKPREHIMLKQDRPYFVTILCLARDAAARLVDGMGTRADICDLLKDSQYINESLTDSQV